jgi:biotin synthase-related radical SAM superfamily protein
MKLTKDFLTANRNEIIEIAQDLMRQNGFEYVSLKEVLVMFSETATDEYTLLEEMEWVVDQLKSKNNASHLVAFQKIQMQSRLNQSVNI